MKIKILEKIKALSIELAIFYIMYVLMRDKSSWVFNLIVLNNFNKLVRYYTVGNGVCYYAEEEVYNKNKNLNYAGIYIY
jgi:hypothetical protein